MIHIKDITQVQCFVIKLMAEQTGQYKLTKEISGI